VQNLKLPNQNVKVMVEGLHRAEIVSWREVSQGFVEVEIRELGAEHALTEEVAEYIRKLVELFEQYAKMSHHLAFEGVVSSLKLDDPDRFADTLASHLLISTAEKQQLLEKESRDTVRSRSFTGKPCRMIRNDWTDAWERPDTPDPLEVDWDSLVVGPIQEGEGLMDDLLEDSSDVTVQLLLDPLPDGAALAQLDPRAAIEDEPVVESEEGVAESVACLTLLASDRIILGQEVEFVLQDGKVWTESPLLDLDLRFQSPQVMGPLPDLIEDGVVARGSAKLHP